MKYGYPKTYAFFQKYSSRLSYLCALILLFWGFAPRQQRHYMKADITAFTDLYYLSICVVLSMVIVLTVFLIVWRKTDVKKAFFSIILSSILSFLISIFFQSILIAICLWINRFSVEEQVKCMYTDRSTKFGRIITEVQTGRILSHEDVSKMELYGSESYLQSSGTFDYTFNKGLLGIKYIPANN